MIRVKMLDKMPFTPRNAPMVRRPAVFLGSLMLAQKSQSRRRRERRWPMQGDGAAGGGAGGFVFPAGLFHSAVADSPHGGLSTCAHATNRSKACDIGILSRSSHVTSTFDKTLYFGNNIEMEILPCKQPKFTASEFQQAFGALSDKARHEPVVINQARARLPRGDVGGENGNAETARSRVGLTTELPEEWVEASVMPRRRMSSRIWTPN